MNIKVLMFGWEFPPYNSGGLGTACLGLSRALANDGVEVFFVLPKKLNLKPSHAKIIFADNSSASSKMIVVNSILSPYDTTYSYNKKNLPILGRHYGGTLFEEVARYANEAENIAKRENFDVIHAHDWLSFPAGVAAKRATGKPLIVHVHSTEIDRTGGNNANKAIYNVEKAGMEAADMIIAVSNYTKQKIIQYYGINGNKIEVVHNGIDEIDWNFNHASLRVKFLKSSGKKIVLFVGRITLQKGPEYFIRAAKKVLEYNPNVIFIVSGSGDMQNQIIQEAAYLGISDKVLFAGFLRDGELQSVYSAADICITPSVSEPFGMIPLEAALHGTPVLVSKQSGVSEVLNHVLKADFWDTDEMANKIISVLWHKSLHKTLQQHSREEARGLSWGNTARKCINIYKKLTGVLTKTT